MQIRTAQLQTHGLPDDISDDRTDVLPYIPDCHSDKKSNGRADRLPVPFDFVPADRLPNCSSDQQSHIPDLQPYIRTDYIPDCQPYVRPDRQPYVRTDYISDRLAYVLPDGKPQSYEPDACAYRLSHPNPVSNRRPHSSAD